ncbi:MAG TPA: hypothetical protein VN848_06550 [Gemmatimonadales bacterium]|nr:hypothetical protein [Gemmatimonadales bacterium]
MPPTALRTAAKLIRFRPDELARITARARACGHTPARFIRETALGAVPAARREPAAADVLRALARLGASLDALARYGCTQQAPGLLDRLTRVLRDREALVRCVVTSHRPRSSP